MFICASPVCPTKDPRIEGSLHQPSIQSGDQPVTVVTTTRNVSYLENGKLVATGSETVEEKNYCAGCAAQPRTMAIAFEPKHVHSSAPRPRYERE